MMQKLSSDSSQQNGKNFGGVFRHCVGLLSLLLFMALPANAQIVQLANESFKKSLPQGWSVYPASTPTAPTWASDTHVTASGKYAMHGYVPYNAGDTVELVTPWYDCTNYKHVQLRFKHICKLLGSDMCQVMYRENNLSSRWKPIPSDAYEGKSVTYKKALYFNDLSYSEWKSNDTFAVADNSWWKEETFDMSDYAGYSTIAFKFVIRKGSYFGSFIADGWHIDDFEVRAMIDSNNVFRLPEASFLSTFADTVFSQGPFAIQAKLVSRSGLKLARPWLHYTSLHNDTLYADSLQMSDVDGGDSLWKTSIPKQPYNTKLVFSTRANDNVGEAVVTDSFYVKERDTTIINHQTDQKGSVGLVSVDKPLKWQPLVQQTVEVTFKNNLNIALTYAELYWTVSGVRMPVVNWVGNVGAGNTGTCRLGTYFPSNVADTIVVWIKNPNYMLDSVTNDDTLTFVTRTCDSAFSGSYTVGRGNYDFQSVADAVEKMTVCGVSGDVNLQVANGVYEGNVSFVNVKTAYNVILSSLSGHADSVVLIAKSGNALNIQSSINLTFENLTFVADSAAGHAVHISGSCRNFTFRNCIFNGRKDVFSSDENYAAVCLSGNDSILFVGNRFNYGTYGLNLSASHVVVDSNQFDAFSYAAVELRDLRKPSRFCHNFMKEGDASHTTLMGMCFRNDKNLIVDGNSLLTKGNTGEQYGMRVYDCDSTVLVSNNEVILHCSKGKAYGIYAAAGTHYISQHPESNYGTKFIHNSVLITGTPNSSFGIFTSANKTAANKGEWLVLRNNLIIIDNQITTSAHPLYVEDYVISSNNNYRNSDLSVWDIDFNTWYAPGNSIACLHQADVDQVGNARYVGEQKLTLAEYRHLAVSAKHDALSYPFYADATYQNLKLSSYAGMTCDRYKEVPDSKEGVARSLLTVRGCYAVPSDKYNVSLGDILDWPENSYFSDTLYPAVTVSNSGSDILIAATLSWELDGVHQTPVQWKGKLPFCGTDTIRLGKVMGLTQGNHTLKAYVNALSAQDYVQDDTLQKTTKTCATEFKGSYTVGDTGFFKSLDTAISTLNECGMSGSVTLQILPGTYFVNTVIPYVNGMDSVHILHITSFKGDSSSVILRRADNSNTSLAAAPLVVNGAEYVKISSLTLDGVGANGTVATCGHALVITGKSSHIEVSGCRLVLPQTLSGSFNSTYNSIYRSWSSQKDNSSGNYSVVHINGNNTLDDVIMQGNLVEGGVCAFYLEGNASHVQRVRILHNTITGIDYAACHLYKADACSFSDNRIFQRKANHSINGFCFMLGETVADSIRNNIVNLTGIGTVIYGCGNARGFVTNNDILGGDMGVYAGVNSDLYVYHNNFYVKTYGLSVMTVAGLPPPQQGRAIFNHVDVYNNIFHTRAGNPIFKPASIGNLYVGGNCYYNDATGSANLNGISMDNTSVSVQPFYKDTNVSLELINISSLMRCDLSARVPYDINGRVRSERTFMGSRDSSGVLSDVALLGFVGVDSLTASIPGAVGVILQNRSSAPIDTAVITLYANRVQRLRMTYHPNTPLAGGGATDTVWLGNLTLQQGFNELLAVVRYATDPMPYNDTVRWSSYVCSGPLAGTYTVFGNKPDFASVEELEMALYTCGISKNVEFRMRPGTYGGLSFEGPVPGSDSCSITFIPDGGAVVFDGGTDGTGLSLDNVSNMTFRGLTFGNRKDGKTGVKLSGSCTNVTFRDCDIYSSAAATSTDYRAVDYTNSNNSTTYPVNVRFIGNRITGGCYNMYLYYLAGKSGQIPLSSLYIDSNTLTDACQYGIYVYYYANIPSISYNRIEGRVSRNGADYCGLHSEYGVTYDLVQGNRILVEGDGAGYGIRLSQFQNWYSSQRGLVVNNEVRASGNKSQYGIWFLATNSKLKIHHNSVRVNSYGDVAYGLHLSPSTNTSNPQSITRNAVSAYGKRPYPLYLTSNTYSDASHGLRAWNNWYANDTIACLAGISCQGIRDLQAMTVDNDSNSVSYMPTYKDTSAGLELKKYDLFACPILADVPYDINGFPRSPVTSMGAYGFEIHDNVNLEMLEILSPYSAANVTCIPERTPVNFSFRNSGVQTARFDSSALKVSIDVTGPVTYHWDTVIRSGMLASGRIDTVMLGGVPVMSNGTYHIKVTLKDSADLYPEDDTLSTDYTVNWIRPPYDVDFSAVPAELLNVRNSGSVDWSVVHDNAMPSSFGTGRLEFAGAGNPGASASAVFNAVDIQGCVNPMLSFWYAHGVNSGTRDILYVFATTDGGASYTTIGRITPTDTTTGWKQYDIDLSRFANEPCLSIVFQAISFGGANQSLDRIRITADADAALTLLPVDFTAFTACENDAVPLKVVVSNITAMPVEYSSDTIRATVTGASNQGFTCVYSKSLVGYESDTITLGGMDLRANGNYYINVSMQSQDDNAQNDTASDSTILIRQDIALDSIVGIDAQAQHPGGDTVYVSALLRNNCNMAVDRFTVTMELNGETVVTDTVLRHMEAGDSIIHAVSIPYVVPFGTKEQPYYFLELSANIPCDGDANNDKRSVVGIINVPDTVDLQVLSIAQPATDSGRVKVSPKVTVANIGNAEVQNVMLHVDVLDTARTLLETVSEYINFINTNDTLEYAFSLTYTVPNYDGSYYLKAYADTYASEINMANDTLTAEFACKRNSTGVVSHTATNWSVGQNEPNPANATTVIPFVIPEDAEVALTIMGVNGQLLHREIVAATAGANRVTLHTGTLPSGLYYYGVEYKGQRIVRKMNVVR